MRDAAPSAWPGGRRDRREDERRERGATAVLGIARSSLFGAYAKRSQRRMASFRAEVKASTADWSGRA